MTDALYLAIGSVAGGLSRYYFGGFVQRVSGSAFPYGTLIVNLAGCLLVGFIASSAGVRFSLNASARVLLISGFCGAFTTFSAFMVESDFLLRSGHAWATLLNIVISIVGGFALFRFGFFIGKLP
ncbi:MAG: fluoride efflux transporter CrcB [Candidatus Omnitrophica bacterium]|nr:fluoride efflux transporter CrcB [Candidatus Omnitrophota bacterium]